MTDPPAPPRSVLVLYAAADEPFVRGFLVPALGAGAVVDACALGSVAIPALEQALHDSSVTVAVLTPAFLSDPWSRQSELLASGAAVTSGHDVIPLVLEDCVLPLHLDAKVQLDFRVRDEWNGQVKLLRDQLARPAPVEAVLACPYPGMRPFEAGDAIYFHGRDREVAAVLALIAGGERELYLVGPSGAGKSSLIAAGVVPKLAPPVVVQTLRPGDAPVRRLADLLDSSAPDAVAAWAARHPGARLVVVVDQLEELFTLAPAAEHADFAASLRGLLAEPRCVLVLAVRADFYAELMQSPLWLDGSRRHVDLPVLRGAALREAIELPARALDVYLEAALVERLLADAANEPGVLPLLQETLVQLWSHRRQRLLTLAAYEALGEGGRSGLAVAISSRADRCLAELTPAQVVIAQRTLLRLVSFGEGRPNTRRRQTRAQLAASEPATELDAVLRQLVAARLITMDGDAHDVEVDLCHEVLITAWPPFAAWVDRRRGDEQRRRQTQASADEWIARGRGASGLLDDTELAAARAWRASDAAAELGESAEVTALIAASEDAIRAARRRWRRRVASVVAAIAMVVAVVVRLAILVHDRAAAAEVARGQADHEHQNAVRMLGEQYREAGRSALTSGAAQRAVPFLVAAREQGIDDPALHMLFAIATRNRVALALRHAGPLVAARFDRDGDRIVTGSVDHTARLWDAHTGAPVTPPLVHDRAVIDAAVSDDGTRVVTISEDNTAWVWDVTARPPTRIALRSSDRINTAQLSADGAVVVTASDDKTARRWDARTGAPIGAPLGHDARVTSAELSRDGARIVTTVSEGLGAQIWDARSGAPIAALRVDDAPGAAEPRAHTNLVTSATFSADGTRVVTASADHTARIWDAATGAPVGPALPHDEMVDHAMFRPDGAQVATFVVTRVRLWDVATGKVVRVIDHPTPVVRIEYSRDGQRLLVQCNDKVVRVWDVATGGSIAELELEAGAYEAAFSPDGTRVVTASADGVARVWTIQPAAPQVLATGARFYDAVYSPDGAHIAVADTLVHVGIWSARGALEATRPHGGLIVAFDRDGRQLATIYPSGEGYLGPITGPTITVPRRQPGERPEPPDPDEASDLPPRPAAAPGAFSPDGARFATTGGVWSARVWDSASGRPVTPRLMHAGKVTTVRFSPDGRHLVTASRDGTARVWDATTGAPIDPPLAHPASAWVTSAGFSPDGTRIATVCTDHQVRLWSAASHQLMATLSGHAGEIVAAIFSPDGALLLTPSADLSARIWDVRTGVLAVPPLTHDQRVESAAFSADGARVVTTSAMIAQVWDVRTGLPLGPPLVHADYARTAAFSPDGNTLVTAAQDAVRVWDVRLDPGTLADWQRLAHDGSFPQLGEALRRLEPASRVAP